LNNIISMDGRRSRRTKQNRDRAPAAPGPSEVLLVASAIREAVARRPMAHSLRERLTLAQNLWSILGQAIEKDPALSKSRILHAAGQGQPDESTKRLPHFAVDPAASLDERNRKASALRKHVAKYVRIASEAARLSGMNENEVLVLLTQGTDYQSLAPAAQQNPYDEALADILTILEQRFDDQPFDLMTVARDYFSKLFANRIIRDPGTHDFRPNAKAWSAIHHAPTPHWRVPVTVANCIPAASLGSCFLSVVKGHVQMRVAEKLAAGIRVHLDGSDNVAPGTEINVPASIEVYASLSIGVFCAEPSSKLKLVFIVRPYVVIPSADLKGVYVEEGKESDPDWEFLGLWDGDPLWGERVAATSSNYAGPASQPESCIPHCYTGEIIIEEGHIVDLRYKIDHDADFGAFSDLGYLSTNECLIEPLSLPAFRKWLLRDVRDDHGDGVEIALPEWIAPDSRHPLEEIDVIRHAISKIADGEAPSSSVGSSEAAGQVAEYKKMARDFVGSSSSIPTSFPEGTLAAALERGLVSGPDFRWGLDSEIGKAVLLNNLMLAVTLATAEGKRKSLLKQ
jgi:hypothetical protein